MPLGGLVTAGVVSGAGSLLGGILGSNAASKASKQVQQGEQNARTDLAGGYGTNITALGQEENTLSPYTTLGAAGATGLTSGLAPGGQFTQTLTPQQILAQDPGYNFQLQQGEQQIQRSAAAQGTGASGGELKDATTYSQNLAENAYQQAFNNFNQTQNQNFSRLLGVTSLGAGAASTSNADQIQSEQNSLGINSQIAGTYTGQGQAAAAGTLGSASAINSGITGLTNAASGVASGYSLYGGTGTSGLSSAAGTLGLTSPNTLSSGNGGILGTGSTPSINANDLVGLGSSGLSGAAGSPSASSLPFGY